MLGVHQDDCSVTSALIEVFRLRRVRFAARESILALPRENQSANPLVKYPGRLVAGGSARSVPEARKGRDEETRGRRRPRQSGGLGLLLRQRASRASEQRNPDAGWRRDIVGRRF